MKRSPLNPRGKKARLWVQIRRAWIKANPPDHHGGYLCGICAKWVHKDEMDLDHILSRSSRPDLFDNMDNLQPTHSWCNQLKGSVHVKPIVTTNEYWLRKELDL